VTAPTAPGVAIGAGRRPPPRQSFIAHVVVDISTTPPTPIETKFTRAEARKFVQWRPDADSLRIRRAKVTLYAK
jgi:hypothetical protein